MARSKKKGPAAGWVAGITIFSFVLALIIGIATRLLLDAIYSLLLSFFILFAVISLGIIFDIIGTAAAAAEQAPLNAKASRKIYGARRAVELVKHADQVANFCNDVIGDISGIVSGMLAALIVSRLLDSRALASFEGAEIYWGILLTALVAGLTVGGKAWGKNVAITRSTEIIFFVGKTLTSLEKGRDWIFLRKKNGVGERNG